MLQVVIESAPAPTGCSTCGVLAHSHGRRGVTLVDVLCFGRADRLLWRKRTWLCPDPGCLAGAFTEQHEDLAAPRAHPQALAAGVPGLLHHRPIQQRRHRSRQRSPAASETATTTGSACC